MKKTLLNIVSKVAGFFSNKRKAEYGKSAGKTKAVDIEEILANRKKNRHSFHSNFHIGSQHADRIAMRKTKDLRAALLNPAWDKQLQMRLMIKNDWNRNPSQMPMNKPA